MIWPSGAISSRSRRSPTPTAAVSTCSATGCPRPCWRAAASRAPSVSTTRLGQSTGATGCNWPWRRAQRATWRGLKGQMKSRLNTDCKRGKADRRPGSRVNKRRSWLTGVARRPAGAPAERLASAAANGLVVRLSGSGVDADTARVVDRLARWVARESPGRSDPGGSSGNDRSACGSGSCVPGSACVVWAASAACATRSASARVNGLASAWASTPASALAAKLAATAAGTPVSAGAWGSASGGSAGASGASVSSGPVCGSMSALRPGGLAGWVGSSNSATVGRSATATPAAGAARLLANGNRTSPMLCTWEGWIRRASGWRLCQATTRINTSLSRSTCMMRPDCWRCQRRPSGHQRRQTHPVCGTATGPSGLIAPGLGRSLGSGHLAHRPGLTCRRSWARRRLRA